MIVESFATKKPSVLKNVKNGNSTFWKFYNIIIYSIEVQNKCLASMIFILSPYYTYNYNNNVIFTVHFLFTKNILKITSIFTY